MRKRSFVMTSASGATHLALQPRLHAPALPAPWQVVLPLVPSQRCRDILTKSRPQSCAACELTARQISRGKLRASGPCYILSEWDGPSRDSEFGLSPKSSTGFKFVFTGKLGPGQGPEPLAP